MQSPADILISIVEALHIGIRFRSCLIEFFTFYSLNKNVKCLTNYFSLNKSVIFCVLTYR